jgi:hypothetical protein
VHDSNERRLPREKLLIIVNDLRERKLYGWYVIDVKGKYEGPYKTIEEAEQRLHTKDPHLMMSGGRVICVDIIKHEMCLCPNCKAIQKADTICTNCKFPIGKACL